MAQHHVQNHRPPSKRQLEWQRRIAKHCFGAIRWDATHGPIAGTYRGALKSSEKKLALLLATILPTALAEIDGRFESTVDDFDRPAVWLLSARGRVRSVQLQWLSGRECRRRGACLRLGAERPVTLAAPDAGAQVIEQVARLAAAWLGENGEGGASRLRPADGGGSGPRTTAVSHPAPGSSLAPPADAAPAGSVGVLLARLSAADAARPSGSPRAAREALAHHPAADVAPAALEAPLRPHSHPLRELVESDPAEHA